MAIEVKVGIIPGKIELVALESGATVNDALAAGGFSDYEQGYTISVNGGEATLDTILNGNASVLLTKKIKGN